MSQNRRAVLCSPVVNLAYNHTHSSLSILQNNPLIDPVDDVIFEWFDDLVQQVAGEKFMDVGSW